MKDIAKRPELTEYMMEIAFVVAKRSTCLHHHVGALLVKEKKIIATGYNGAPTGFRHCTEAHCPRADSKSGTAAELCVAVHAEQNCIAQAALHGTSTKGASLYTTHQPCSLCAKLLVNAGIKEVFYCIPYDDIKGFRFFDMARIPITKIDIPEGVEIYE